MSNRSDGQQEESFELPSKEEEEVLRTKEDSCDCLLI